MSQFRVSFFKRLQNSQGHQFKCLQDRFDIPATDAAQAERQAARQFEQLHRTRDWRTNADVIEVESA